MRARSCYQSNEAVRSYVVTRGCSIVAVFCASLLLLPAVAKGDALAPESAPVDVPDPGEAPPVEPIAEPTAPVVIPEPIPVPLLPPTDPRVPGGPKTRPPTTDAPGTDSPTPDGPVGPTSDGPTPDGPVEPGVGDASIVAIDLEWRTVVGCPATDRVLAVTGALLGRRVAVDPTARLVVRADVVNDGTRFVADVDIDGPGGATRRQLHATDCGTLTEAVALVVATNVDPRAVAATVAGERTTDSGDGGPPRRRPPPADTNDASTSGPRRVGLALSILGGPAIGATPRITGWLQGGLSLSYGRALVGVYGGHGFARPDDRVTSLRASLSTGGVRGCFVPTQGRIAVPLCGLVEGGAVVARNELDDSRVVSGWAGLGAGAGIEWAPHPRIALQGSVDALAALRRPKFVVVDTDSDDNTVVLAPAVVRVLLGIAVRLR